MAFKRSWVSNPTISMSHMLKVLIVQGFQHIFCLNTVFIPFYPALHRYMEVTPMPHHRKKTIAQILNECSSEQEYGSCLDCGDDACCEYSIRPQTSMYFPAKRGLPAPLASL